MSRDELVNEVVTSFSTMGRLMKAYLHDGILHQEIGASQLQVLACVATWKPAPTQKMLAQYLHVTPGALTQLIEPLVENGLVVREASSTDRRIMHVTLSREGKQRLQALKTERGKLLASLLQSLSDQELEAMLSTQKKMFDALERHYNNQE